ncbi:hypothetical protein AXG93_1860s1180 [Marchantia polymorpha subsp. ruderalis]|uniref:Uncharacterized protein n=1 Tax=Marchantia polymorpha subsp. ruderalis TaxID=1480154 RepID=A0A176VEI8_MARPO|nr:hypothetical protein AXG93_1860s1180 [Marchantia polymorpha subsp. ruderalis]
MDDQVKGPQVPVYGGIRAPPPVDVPGAAHLASLFPVEQMVTSLAPLGLSPEQVTAEEIHKFGGYARQCVEYLQYRCRQLEEAKCLAKDSSMQLMMNLSGQIRTLEFEKKSLEEDLEMARRRLLSSPEPLKRGSSKRKGDQLYELPQRQTSRKVVPSKSCGTVKHQRQKLNLKNTGIPISIPDFQFLKLPCAAEHLNFTHVGITDVDMKDADVNEQDAETSLPSVDEGKTLEEESANEAVKGAHSSRAGLANKVEDVVGGSNNVEQLESSVIPDPSEQGENEKTKSSSGEKSSLTGENEKAKSSDEEKSSLTSGPHHIGEQSLLLAGSHLVEDSHSGANDAHDGDIQTSPVSEKPSHEQDPPKRLRKTTSDGLDSSFSTSKQGTEEGDHVQSVFSDEADKADTTAALSLCKLITTVVDSEPVKESDDCCPRKDAPIMSPTNHTGSNFPQDNSHQQEAKKKKKSSCRSKCDPSGSSSGMDHGIQRTPDLLQPGAAAANSNVHDHKSLIQGSLVASGFDTYSSRDQRRVVQVARQLLSFRR